MARISDEDVERVRAASDIVQIAGEHCVLKKAGRKFKACCPFHQEKTPSFQVDPEMGLWHCFGCGEGGDVFDFVMRIENMDFPDAVRYLADRAHIEIVETQGGTPHQRGYKDRLYECMSETASFYHLNLMRSSSPQANAARAYLSGRGFGSAVCKRWNLGYAPGRGALVAHLREAGFTPEEMVSANVAYANESGALRDRFYERVMFPIQDRLGKTIAFGGRIIGKGEPKYLNTSDTPLFTKSRNLYGIEKAKDAITSQGCAIIVEGYTDTISLHEAGITNVVATLGTALTTQHLRMLRNLRPRRIVYLFDGDSAGQKAADRASEFIDKGITPESGADYIEFSVVVLPGNLDPAEYVAAHGKQGMDEQLADAQPLIRFALNRRLGEWDLTKPEERNRAMLSAVALLSPVKDSIIAIDYANYIADRLGVPFETVMNAVRNVKPQKVSPMQDDAVPYSVPMPKPQRESEPERIARECLSLVAACPKLIGNLEKTGTDVNWPTQIAGQVAQAMVSLKGAGCSPRELVAKIDEQVSGAAAYLGAGTIEFSNDEQAVSAFRSLIGQVRENDLLTRIRSGNSRLKMASTLSEQEYDAIFKDVSAMQKELNRLRNQQQQP